MRSKWKLAIPYNPLTPTTNTIKTSVVESNKQNKKIGMSQKRLGSPVQSLVARRGDIITNKEVGRVVSITDGKNLRQVKILNDHINMKYGALVLTKRTPKYKKKA